MIFKCCQYWIWWWNISTWSSHHLSYCRSSCQFMRSIGQRLHCMVRFSNQTVGDWTAATGLKLSGECLLLCGKVGGLEGVFLLKLVITGSLARGLAGLEGLLRAWEGLTGNMCWSLIRVQAWSLTWHLTWFLQRGMLMLLLLLYIRNNFDDLMNQLKRK